MYADLVKIHDQDALASSRDVWCEVQQLSNWYKANKGCGGAVVGRRERLTCGPGSKALPRRAFFFSM